MAATIQHETIIPLIQISRKLQAASPLQLSIWMPGIFNVFQKHHHLPLFSKLLLQGFAAYHRSIPTNLWEEIQRIAPKEDDNLIIDDSIAKSAVNIKSKQKQKRKLTLINMASDLQCSFCTFLHLAEVNAVQKTCRCLAIVARNPNALFHVETTYTTHLKHINHFQHERFARIQSLKLEQYEFVTDERFSTYVKIFENFQIFSYICRERVMPQNWFDEVETLELWDFRTNHFSQTFAAVRTLHIHDYCGDGDIDFPPLNSDELRHLILSSAVLSANNWLKMLQYPQLKTLTLKHTNHCCLEEEKTISYLQDLQCNCLRNLKLIWIDTDFLMNSLPILNLLICNGPKKKLIIDYAYDFDKNSLDDGDFSFVSNLNSLRLVDLDSWIFDRMFEVIIQKNVRLELFEITTPKNDDFDNFCDNAWKNLGLVIKQSKKSSVSINRGLFLENYTTPKDISTKLEEIQNDLQEVQNYAVCCGKLLLQECNTVMENIENYELDKFQIAYRFNWKFVESQEAIWEEKHERIGGARQDFFDNVHVLERFQSEMIGYIQRNLNPKLYMSSSNNHEKNTIIIQCVNNKF